MFRSRLPHSAACCAARCNSSLVESLKNWVMSTCSAPRRPDLAASPPPMGIRRGPSGVSPKDLSKKSSNRLPPPPKGERLLPPPLTSAACSSQRCSVLGPSPDPMRLTVTTAGLLPHTSQSLVANSLCLPLTVKSTKHTKRKTGRRFFRRPVGSSASVYSTGPSGRAPRS